MSIALMVNGASTTVDDGTSMRALIAQLNFPDRGIAVALDGALYPKARWDDDLADGHTVEILTAVQGG